MINLSAIMGRLGKGTEGNVPPGALAAGEGVATGGAFAALVAFAAQASPRATQGELGLVVDNGAVVATAALPGDGGAAALDLSDAATLPPAGEEAVPAALVLPRPGSGKPAAATHGVPLNLRGEEAPQSEASALPASDLPADAVVTSDTMVAGDAATDAMKADEALPTPVAATIGADPAGAPANAVLAQWTGPQAVDAGPAAAGKTVAAPAQVKAVAEGQSREAAKAAAQAMAPPPLAGADSKAGDRTTAGRAPGHASETAQVATIGTGASASLAGVAMPLRMIVESLPPVVQSTLAAGVAATVSGPTTSAQLGEQIIDMGVSGQWIDRMAREITALAEGNGHSRFTLNPPHLGRLQVDLWQAQDMTSVRLVAETDEAARRLTEGRPALHADARMAAINLGSITVEKAAASQDAGQRPGSQPSGQMQQQMAGQGQGQGQHHGQEQTRSGSQPQGDWIGRSFRDQPSQSGEASPGTADRRAAGDTVRFA